MSYLWAMQRGEQGTQNRERYQPTVHKIKKPQADFSGCGSDNDEFVLLLAINLLRH